MFATHDKTGVVSRATTWLVVVAALSAVTASIALVDPGSFVERHVRSSFPGMTASERAQEVQGITSFVIVIGVLGLACALWTRRRVRRGHAALRTAVPAAVASAVAVVAALLPGNGQRPVLPLPLGVMAGLALVAAILAIGMVVRNRSTARRA